MKTTTTAPAAGPLFLLRGRRLLATLVVLIGVGLLIRTGLWQLDRHQQRAAINAQIAAGLRQPPLALNTASEAEVLALDYRPATARGVYDPSQEVLLRNQALDGAPGYRLLTPLRLTGSDAAVLVDRGWIPLTQSDPEARQAFAPPAGEVTVTGVARRTEPYAGGPQDPPLGPERPRLDAWFRVDTARIMEQLDYPLLPAYIQVQPTPGAPRTLPQPIATADLGLGSHLGYALQWFAFAAILLIGYIVVSYRQPGGRKRSDPGE